MTVWCHLPTIFKPRFVLRIAGLLTLVVALITTVFFGNTSYAVAGINQAISFQGRLLNAGGGIVADGHYNIQFKIYQDGSGTAAGNPDGTLKWTETYINNGGTSGVEVRNGYFSVDLGSVTPFGTSVDWNQDTLWLSMNVAGSATACTTFGTSPCTADGEMLSMKRLTATPYALNAENANKLGGLTSADYIQSTTTLQNANIAVQSSGAANVAALIQGAASQTADIFQVKANGTSTPLLSVTSQGFTHLQGTTEDTDAFSVKTHLGNSVFRVDTANVRVGVGLLGTSAPNLTGTGLEVNGALRLSGGIGGGGDGTDTFITPVGTSVDTKINIPLYNPGDYGQILALGIPSGANATSRVISLFDARTTAHQPTIGVFSPDENNLIGFSWDGSNTIAAVKNTGNTLALQGNGLNILTAKNNSGTANVGIGNDASAGYALDVTGSIRASSSLYAPSIDTASGVALDIGTTNATAINLNENVNVASGKSLTLNGGNTASRPASPTEGMVYFDTDTKQLLTYANGKWQSDAKATDKIVAATNSSQAAKDGADYVANGEDSAGSGVGSIDGDQVQINQALSDVSAAGGGTVYLAAGTYTVDAAVSVPANVVLVGTGNGTVIQLGNFGSTSVSIDAISIAGSDATVRDLSVNGRKSINTNGTQTGISISTATVTNVTVDRVMVHDFKSNGIYSGTMSDGRIVNSNFDSNGSYGIYLIAGEGVTVSANSASGNGSAGIAMSGARNVLIGNHVADNVTYGIRSLYSSYSTITSNTVEGTHAIGIASRNSIDLIISNNSITGTSSSAINIDSSDTQVSLSNNRLGGNVISDSASDTIYSNQIDSTGKLISKSSAGTKVQTSTDNTTAFQVQNAAGTSALTVDTTTNSVLVASTLDTTTATTLSVGSANATSITIGKSSSNIATTVLGTAIFKPTTGNDSTTAFQLQRADGTKMLVADSTNQTITFGNSASGNYTVFATNTGAITKYGSARNTKKITLTAEYTGSVLDAGSGSNNTGIMTSSVDLTNRMNYYKWTTSQGTNQNYDIVVQIPLPTDFDGWASSNPLSVATYTSNTTNGTITLEARDSSGTVQCNFVSVTPGSTSTWATNNSACTLSSGTYTAGDYITLRLRMQSPNSGDVRVGNINLSYLSKY